jgi:hypothetical protein
VAADYWDLIQVFPSLGLELDRDYKRLGAAAASAGEVVTAAVVTSVTAVIAAAAADSAGECVRLLLLLLVLIFCQPPAAAGRRLDVAPGGCGGWLACEECFGGNWIADVVALQLGDHHFVDLVLSHLAGVGCFQTINKLFKFLYDKILTNGTVEVECDGLTVPMVWQLVCGAEASINSMQLRLREHGALSCLVMQSASTCCYYGDP